MYRVPVMRKPVIGDKYLSIDLETVQGTVSLGLNRENLYTAAYLAENNQKVFTAYYFSKQITPTELGKLFPKAAAIVEIKYGEDYQAIETKARVKSRIELGLGIQKLKFMMARVTGKAREENNEAKFLLLAIQVVSEAARFKYIEGLVRKNYPDDSASNDKVIQFEKNWSAISKAVYENAKDGVFTKAYDFGFGKVRQVKDLEMGLFMNVGGAKSSIESNVTDHDIAVV
ncbi:hypothetical protein RND81_04G015000 [Saponaria officinalis]